MYCLRARASCGCWPSKPVTRTCVPRAKTAPMKRTSSTNWGCDLSRGNFRVKYLPILIVACMVTSAVGGERGVDLGAYRNIPLWDGPAPDAAGDGPLDAPFLTVFQPRAGTANGGAVVIAPGGGNIMLMYGAEGADAAEVFNDWGVTAFVLTYRLSPRYDQVARTRDAERALRLVRAHTAA